MTHPEADRLSAFARGQVASAEADQIERHLAECPQCCERAAQAGKDGFIAQLQVAACDTNPSVLMAATAAEATPREEAPEALRDHARYRVLRLLGRGGMGEVYLAEHVVMQRMVALKVIRTDLVSSPALAERFKREVLAAAKLSHPNVVAALDAEQADDTHFLVMEYVEGVSAAAALRNRGPLPLAEACEIARQAALALQHAHERGLIHRDIKPENLLITTAGQTKVADFGLARLTREGASTTTSAGVLIGTVDYIAPEQANDPAKADGRVDVYSLGCTLYHLLAGQVPYPGGGVLDKLARHQGGKPMPLGQLRTEVPAKVCRLVERMMAPDPSRRYATPGDAAEALAPWCQERSQCKKSRRWPLVAAGMAALLVLLAGAAVYTFRTSKGTIEVVTDDLDVTVSVRKNGEEVVILDEKAKRKVVVLPEGEYDLALIDNGKRLELSMSRVKLKRGGKEIVEVRRLPEQFAVGSKKDQQKDKAKQPNEKTKSAKKGLAEKPLLPADLERLEPAMDDTFLDLAKSAFHRGRQVKLSNPKYRTEITFAGIQGWVVALATADFKPRYYSNFHSEGKAGDFACRLVGQVDSQDKAFWGLVLRGGEGETFVVRLWNSGEIETGHHRVKPWETADEFAYPKLRRTAHKAINKDKAKNELTAFVEGRRLRLFVNGEQVADPLELPVGFDKMDQGFSTHTEGLRAARFTFSRFTLWNLSALAKVGGGAKTLPDHLVEAMKAKPDIEDDFTDQKKSAFDPMRTLGFMTDKKANIRYVYDKGLSVEFDKFDKAERYAILPPMGYPSGDFVCRAVGSADAFGAWGLVIRAFEPSASFVVRVWHDGEIEIGPSPMTGKGVPHPVLARKAHPAVRKGKEKNELVVVAKEGEFRVFVNGVEAAAAQKFDKAFAQTMQGLYTYDHVREPSKVTFHQFRRWKLAAK